jgi:hypothetical protein
MNEAFAVPPGAVRRSPEASVLSSWKEIARYLGKSVRTVQRWELTFGLPVRRTGFGGPESSVFAVPTEIDGWIHSCCISRGHSEASPAEVVGLQQVMADLRAECFELRRQIDVERKILESLRIMQ